MKTATSAKYPVRIPRQSDSDAETLAHAQGKVFNFFLSGVFQPYKRQQIINAVKRRNPKDPVLGFQIFFRAHIQIERRGLYYGAHAFPGIPDGTGRMPLPIKKIFA